MSAHISINGPYKKGQRWTAYAYCPERDPAQKHFSLRTSSKSVARQKLREIEGEIARGEWDPWESSRPRTDGGPALGQAVDDYVEACERKQQAESTIRAKRQKLASFAEHAGEDVPVRLLSADELRAWLHSIEGRGGGSPSPHTIRNYCLLASGFFTWLGRRGHVEGNPASKIDLPNAPTTSRKALRPYEVDRLRRRLISALPRYAFLAPIVDLAAAAGLRREEVSALPLGHCHLRERGKEYIEVAAFEDERAGYRFSPKHGRERRVELYPRAAALLRAVAGERIEAARKGNANRWAPVFTLPRDEGLNGKAGDRISYNIIGVRISEAASAAFRGRGVTMHWLRHTHATWITNDMNWPLPVAQEQLGHEDITTTRGYVHATQGSARAAMNAGLKAVGLEVDGPTGEDAREVGRWLTKTDLPYLDEIEAGAGT